MGAWSSSSSRRRARERTTQYLWWVLFDLDVMDDTRYDFRFRVLRTDVLDLLNF